MLPWHTLEPLNNHETNPFWIGFEPLDPRRIRNKNIIRCRECLTWRRRDEAFCASLNGDCEHQQER